MPSTVRPTARQSLLHSQTARRFIGRHLTLLFFLVSLGAVALPSLFVDAQVKLRRTAARAGIHRPARLTKSGNNKSSKSQSPMFAAATGSLFNKPPTLLFNQEPNTRPTSVVEIDNSEILQFLS